jgi:hypothetical protein
MLYLIGGPGRSGKTTLAMQLNRRHGIPYFSLDYLMMGLYHGAPELKIDPYQPESTVTPRMWPVVRPLLTAMLENGEEYCVEGFAIMPEHVLQLTKGFAGSIKACFLGYCCATPAQKLEQERRYRTSNPWPLNIAHEKALAEFELIQQMSCALQNECARVGYAYFDTSADFEKAIASAQRHLTQAQQ